MAALSALGHARRMEALKLLISAAPEGLLAGEIADRLGSKQNTMSTNLAVLLRARLVKAAREGRGVRYTADTQTFAAMLEFLIADCCDRQTSACPELDSVLESVRAIEREPVDA
ncbi:MAG: helix-turn-helix transcriptional regulator [Pseudomonadota bacterium]